MQYHEYQPSTLLSGYVQTIWAMESEDEPDICPRTLIMPDGIVEIVFHYASPLFTYQGGTRVLQHEHVAFSMMRKYIEIESNGKTGFIGARFYPWGAYHFFDTPIHSFLDNSICASVLWADDSKKIIRELKNTSTLEDRFKSVEHFLEGKLTAFQKDESMVDEAVKLIRGTKGILPIDEVCRKTGFVKKQLERKFLSLVGTTPKLFSRVCRFLNICRHLDEQKGKSLTSLAYECGYYDQSHFINEFKDFSGFTPRDFFAKENIWFTEI